MGLLLWVSVSPIRKIKIENREQIYLVNVAQALFKACKYIVYNFVWFFSLKRFPNYVCLRLYKTSSIPRWVHVPSSEALNSDLIQIHNILKKEPKLLERKTGNHTILSLFLPTPFSPSDVEDVGIHSRLTSDIH